MRSSPEIRRSRTGGLTVLEMLLTTLLLALATMIVAEGSSSVNAVYRRTMAKADAQMVLSQIETQLREELRFAEDVDMSDPAHPLYQWHGGWCGIQVYDGVLYRRWEEAADDTPEEDARARERARAGFDDERYPLTLKDDTGKLKAGVEPLSETAMTSLEGIHVPFPPTIAYDPANGLFTVSGLQVWAEDGHTLAGPMTFHVRAVNRSRSSGGGGLTQPGLF